jgi:hypothetical protein
MIAEKKRAKGAACLSVPQLFAQSVFAEIFRRACLASAVRAVAILRAESTGDSAGK